MPATAKRIFELSADQAKYIDRLVESGAYETGSEVVRAGLRALREREISLEEWLLEEVIPVVDLMDADPSRGIPSDRVLAGLQIRHEERTKRQK